MLAACCGSLGGASESLCTEVVSYGNGQDCSTELSQLQAGGECASPISGGPDGGGPTDAGPVVVIDSTTPPGPLSGTYKGYIESFMFPDGSDTVVMTLSFAPDGTITGTVFFGDSPPLAPPTDPDVGYPPGYTGMGPGAPLERFAFTIFKGTYTPPRLQLQIDPRELWKAWCELQTAIYPQYNGASDGGCGDLFGYGCLPNAGFSSGPEMCTWTSCQEPNPTPIDCGKLALCGGFAGPQGVCTCTATSCTVPLGASGGIAFDMQLASGVLDGSTTGIQGGPLNVHLTKQ
jgi:hypothetical protein